MKTITQGNSDTHQIQERARLGNAVVSATEPDDPTYGMLWFDTTAASQVTPIRTETSDYTATAADFVILVDATSGPVTITLPAAALNDGRHYHVKKIDASANTVTIDGNGSETIDGLTTQVMTIQYTSRHVVSDASNWSIL